MGAEADNADPPVGGTFRASVRHDASKFNHALVGLDEESVALIAIVLSECSYDRLKDQLITRLSVSKTAKLNHLLLDLTLAATWGNEATGWDLSS